MFKINNLTMKNFMSIGNVTQAVSFDTNQLTLVLGENLDLGGDDAGARNGVGKTTILNGLSYGLFGTALTRIKKDNLINKTNGKNMLVTVEFERNGQIYHIERGRRRGVLKFFCGQDELEVEDEAQGDSRQTQKTIEEAFGMSHDMFKHIVALNTYTEPFLALNNTQQRDIIEQLLGITLLSEKADQLKDDYREMQRLIAAMETQIAADIDANKRIQTQIDSLMRRGKLWDNAKTQNINDFNNAINTLNKLDVDAEIELHASLAEWNRLYDDKSRIVASKASKERQTTQTTTSLNNIFNDLETLDEKKCHTCGQAFHGDKHKEAVDSKLAAQEDYASRLEILMAETDSLTAELEQLSAMGDKPATYYTDIEDAYNHRNSIINLEEQLKAKEAETDPYKEQIVQMREEAIKEIDYAEINEYGKLRDHQMFLYKLLTNKDSFIRKRIIEQNLAHLNARLSYYLDEMGLPHQVKFLNDLSVEITELGRDLDFDNLSRGERNRLILSLSWAFRDVWEALYQPINLLFIDELVDSGLDSKGVDAALGVLKKMSRDRNKSIWLVSHRDELISRVGSILKVRKENGYTNFSQDE